VIVSVSPEAERELIDGAVFYADQANTELGLAFKLSVAGCSVATMAGKSNLT